MVWFTGNCQPTVITGFVQHGNNIGKVRHTVSWKAVVMICHLNIANLRYVISQCCKQIIFFQRHMEKIRGDFRVRVIVVFLEDDRRVFQSPQQMGFVSILWSKVNLCTHCVCQIA